MDELASLDQSTRESALERFRIIQPCLAEDSSLSLIARRAGIPYRNTHPMGTASAASRRRGRRIYRRVLVRTMNTTEVPQAKTLASSFSRDSA
jgi:hypothetical protein